jgi:plastocyanin/mono/diheme cytochrome c family protein
MNTSKQVNVMIGLMFVFLIGTLLYFLWDSVRAEDAQENQIVTNAERGGRLFSLNCRSCHGMNGLGPLENSNLPGIPLNVDTNRPDDPGKLLERQSRILDTIRCGRVGTLMPAWAEDQGGPLNDFQILQLVALITGAMPGLDAPADPNAVSELGWEAALEEADRPSPHGDLLEGKKLAEAASASATTLVLTDAQKLTNGNQLRIDEEVVKITHAPVGSTLLDDVGPDETELPVKDAGTAGFKAGDTVQVGSERMTVNSASGDLLRVERGVGGTEAGPHRVEAPVFEPDKEIAVERASFGTKAAEHEAGTQVFAGPIEPPKGPVTGADGIPPCGQLAPAAAPSPGPGATPVAVQGEVAMDMVDNFFQLSGQNNPTLSVKVGQAVKVNLTNKGTAIHNMRSAGEDGSYDSGDDDLASPLTLSSGATGTLEFTFDKAGTFPYRCDIHPDLMKGEIVVSQ